MAAGRAFAARRHETGPPGQSRAPALRSGAGSRQTHRRTNTVKACPNIAPGASPTRAAWSTTGQARRPWRGGFGGAAAAGRLRRTGGFRATPRADLPTALRSTAATLRTRSPVLHIVGHEHIVCLKHIVCLEQIKCSGRCQRPCRCRTGLDARHRLRGDAAAHRHGEAAPHGPARAGGGRGQPRRVRGMRQATPPAAPMSRAARTRRGAALTRGKPPPYGMRPAGPARAPWAESSLSMARR